MSDKPNTIRRAKHGKENPYFFMHRDTAQDENLSWEARGVMAYLLSKPDNWEVKISDLAQQCASGRVYRILNELSDAGYIVKPKKSQGDGGKWEWTPYFVYERPFIPDSQSSNEPYTDFPDTDEPYTENSEIIDIREIQNTDYIEPAVTPISLLQSFTDRTPSPYQKSMVNQWCEKYGDDHVLKVMQDHIQNGDTDIGSLLDIFEPERKASKDKQHEPKPPKTMKDAYLIGNSISPLAKISATDMKRLDALEENENVTPQQVLDFITDRFAQPWWTVNRVGLGYILREIDVWVEEHKPAPQFEFVQTTDEKLDAEQAELERQRELNFQALIARAAYKEAS